jgi:hypothetical protein
MSAAAIQASKFYEQVVSDDKVFTFDDGSGYLVFRVDGADVVPFWSSRTRLEKIRKTHPKYSKQKIAEEPFPIFVSDTLPFLEKEGIRVGVNWSGQRLTGFDITVADLRRNLQHWIDRRNQGEHGEGGKASPATS